MRKKISFFIFITVFSILYFIREFGHYMSLFNTTLYAFNYDHGFISRGFIGSLWKIADGHTAEDLMTYQAVYRFSIYATIFLYVLVLLLGILMVRKTDDHDKKTVYELFLILTIFTVPMFITTYNFGRIDIFLIMITIICIAAITMERLEWIVIPCCIIATCIHQGFVFMNVNIILVLLLYKAITAKAKKSYYWIILILTFISVSVLFLYFEFFSHGNMSGAYDEIVNNAKLLSPDGKTANIILIDHELLGTDVYEEELVYHQYNHKTIPVALVCFLPYLLIAGRVFGRLLKNKKGWDLIKYIAIIAGPLTLLPEMVLKVDYGRYAYAIVFYYAVLFITLIALRDETVINAVNEEKQYLKQKLPVPQILFVYPMLFMPLYDIYMGDVIDKLVTMIYR